MAQPPIFHDYYYGTEAEQYTFYHLPKVLFTNSRYKNLSDSAKVLYGLMLDRMGLSMKNGWLDEKNRVFIYFTLEDVTEQMNCKNDKGVKLLAELDTIKGVAKGNNGLTKVKYITFGIESDNLKAAKPWLERIETDVLNNFKALGVTAIALNCQERLALLHSIFNAGTNEKFRFNWNMLPQSGLSTKDYIAPSSFDFRGKSTFRMGRKHGAISHLQILAPELTDTLLADFLDMESNVLFNLHMKAQYTEDSQRLEAAITSLRHRNLTT